MRHYRPDGTFQDEPEDTEFGWFFSDISIDESSPEIIEHNEKIKGISRFRKSHFKCSRYRYGNVEEPIGLVKEMPSSSKSSGFFETIEESIYVVEERNKPTVPTNIRKIDLNIEIQLPTTSTAHQMNVEGFIENPESHFVKEIANYKIPSKSKIINLINPVNYETKALLSVVSHAKYQTLNDKGISEDVLKRINFRTTNSKHLINEKNYSTSLTTMLNDDETSPIFLLNDYSSIDLDYQMYSEIKNYNATKEDNMLSLMMELVNNDLESDLGDVTELNAVNERNKVGEFETSDLGNSIQSSFSSKEGTRLESKHLLEIPNRSDILSSIGLSDAIDRSIETFTKIKSDMHRQLREIKNSFKDDEKKIDRLIEEANSLEKNLRETAYLDNLLHLLNGNPDKVKNKKWPFIMFRKSIEWDVCNLIV